MNWQTLIHLIGNEIALLAPCGLVRNDIAVPNTPFDPAGKRLYLEISTSSHNSFTQTEYGTCYGAYVNIIVCTPVGIGTERIDLAASRIAAHFSYAVNGNAFLQTSNGESVYVWSVEQLPGIAIKNTFKINVRLGIRIYPDEL